MISKFNTRPLFFDKKRQGINGLMKQDVSGNLLFVAYVIFGRDFGRKKVELMFVISVKM